MRLSYGLLGLVLLGCDRPEVCRPGQQPVVIASQRHGTAGFHPYGHSHNDYQHSRPLEDALAERFYSVEADIFYSGGQFEVSHGLLPGSKGTLAQLYLNPLQARVSARGSVHGDGLPFTLWIDLKENPFGMAVALEALLAQYPMLSWADQNGTHSNPVTVVLTGHAEGKEQLVALPTRHAMRDSSQFDLNDPPSDSRWQYYALPWGTYIDWNGVGSFPSAEQRRLACLVEASRSSGRRLRFYAAPDRAEVWRTLLDHGVDFIHTDRLEDLRKFLDPL